jgi:hypothetical protein
MAGHALDNVPEIMNEGEERLKAHGWGSDDLKKRSNSGPLKWRAYLIGFACAIT